MPKIWKSKGGCSSSDLVANSPDLAAGLRVIGYLIQLIAKHFHIAILFFQLVKKMRPNLFKPDRDVLLDHVLFLELNSTNAEQTLEFAGRSAFLWNWT